jgi:hypothetical protein
MSHSFISLQRAFKFKKIRKELSKFRNIALGTKIKSVSFDDATKILCNKLTLHKTNSLLNSIDRIMNPDSVYLTKNNTKNNRIFLSAYLLLYHSDKIFININKCNKTELIKIAESLIKSVETTLLMNESYKEYSLKLFGLLYNTYVINYKLILEEDRQCLFNELFREYSNLTITKKYIEGGTKYTIEQKTNIIAILDNSMVSVMKLGKLVDKNFELKVFDDFCNKERVSKRSFETQYWDNLKDDIDQRNNFSNVFILLETIKNTIYDVSPNRTKDEIKLELEEFIDLPFIKQKLEYNVMKRDEVFALCEYIWKKITELQASVRDNDSLCSWSDIVSLFNESNTLGICLSKFFKEVFKIIDDIFCDILLYPLLLNVLT